MKPMQTAAPFTSVLMLACLALPAMAQPVVETVAGSGNYAHSGDGGPATAAGIDAPAATAIIPGGGGFYLAASSKIRKVDAQGIITSVAGDGDENGSTHGFDGDGGPAIDALFSGISALAYDWQSQSLYVADQDNARIRRIDQGGIVTTVAGNGYGQFSATPGPATERPLRYPTAIAFDGLGNLYIADYSSIRRLAPDGVLHPVAGSGSVGYNGDGIPAIGAKLNMPDGLAVGNDNSLYISDRGNGRLRRIGPDGIITTVAQVSPTSLAVDYHGNLFYGRSDTRRLERYLPHTGTIQPVAGTGVAGYGGDGGPAAQAQFADLEGLSVDHEDGSIYIADTGNWRIRRISSVDEGAAVAGIETVDHQTIEGDAGTVPVRFRIALDRPAATPVVFEATTEDLQAESSHDYQALDAQPFVIPAGQDQGEFVVLVNGDQFAENDEQFQVHVTLVEGAVFSGGGYVNSTVATIMDDDEPLPIPFAIRDDRLGAVENDDRRIALALSNDHYQLQADGSISVIDAPDHGEVEFLHNHFWYTPPPDWTGEDPFVYRVCESAGRCRTATATMVVRPVDQQYISADGHSGRKVVEQDGLRAMAGSEFNATPLVAPAVLGFDLGVDMTPDSPWDGGSGVSWTMRTIDPPPAGQGREWRILARDATQFGFDAMLHLGVDDNGDGLPSADELRCVQDDERRCEMALVQGAGQALRYWVLLQGLHNQPEQVQLEVFEVPFLAADGSFAATGPGHLPADQVFDLTFTWNDPTFLPGQRRAAYVRVKSDAGTPTGDFPVVLDNAIDEGLPIRLVSGVTQRVAIQAGARRRHVYLDVPVGTQRLTVTSASAANIDLHLVPMVLPQGASTTVAGVAEPYTAAGVGEGPTGNEQVVVQAGLLQPARWYVVAINRDGEDAIVDLTATIEATAPVVRPGSYFNEARSGHGLFLYPAGAEWAGLWYTYREDHTPTWYYLQAPAPGGNGLWTAPIYRAAWNGTSNRLTQVGTATVTPTGPDAFQFSFSVDGLAGSEPMTALGRGCPSLGGVPQDLSSHWFDPANAGTGYSVQMLPNYEFLAAFVYDGLGEPRFLVAEKPGFGDADEVLAVEQLRGACPTCTYQGRPARFQAGTLRRVIGGGGLQRIELDAIFDPMPLNPVIPGAWGSIDLVQPLGGPGTTQGCAP